MLRTRFRKIVRDVWARKGRTALVSLAIFVGVAGVITLFSLSDIVVGQLREDIKEDELAMLDIFVSNNAGEELDNEAYLERLKEVPGVTQVQFISQRFTSFTPQPQDDDFKEISLIALEAAEQTELVEGEYPAEGQVAIDERSADKFKLDVGDIIYLPVTLADSSTALEQRMISAVVASAASESDTNFYLSPEDVTRFTPAGEGQTPRFVTFKLEDMNLFAYNEPLGELSLEPMRIIEGEYPGEGEVVVEKRTAEHFGLELGDTVYFRVLSQDAASDIEPRTISGIVFHPYAFGDTNMYGLPADVNYISGTTGYNLISTRFDTFAVAEAENENFASVIKLETPYRPDFIGIEDPAKNSLITGAQTIAATMGFLAMIALVVSGFLVINVISSIVIEQKRQIGVMKSIGASYGDNVFMYSGIAFMYGLIAVILGVAAGIPLGNMASHALAPELNTSLEGFKVSPFAIFMGIVMGLVIPVLASIIPVALGARVKILHALTDLGINANYGSGPLAKIIAKLPVPITIRQGLSNVSIKKSRLLFTVITLSIAAGAFMGIFWVFDSLTGGIQVFLDSFNVEIAVFPNETRADDEIRPLLEEKFMQGEDAMVTSIEPGFQYQVEFEGYEPQLSAGGPPGIFAYGFDVSSDTPAFNVEVTEGDELNDENGADGIILSSLLAINLEKEVGDQVVLEVPGNSEELTVVGIAEYPLEQVWMDWRTLARITGYIAGAPQPNRYFTTVAVEGYEGSAENAQVYVGGFNEQLSGMLSFAEGEFLTPGESEVIVTADFADKGGYSVGDTLTLTAANGSTAEVTIAGIFTVPPQFQEGIAEQGISPDVIAMDFQELVALEGISLEGQPMPQAYFMMTNLEDPTADQLDDVIEQMEVVMQGEGIPTGFFNFVDLVDQINSGFTTIQAILQMVAGLIALVGALGLLTTLSMSVFERQKEIGVMRSIGASSSTIALQFLTEGLVVGMIAWIVGIPLGYLIQIGLLEATGFIDTFPVLNPLEGMTGTLLGLFGMIFITILASIIPSLSAARKTVSDILRYQ